MGWWEDLFGGEEKVEPEVRSTMSPEQQQMMSQLLAFVSGKVGQGLPAWTGGFSAPMTNQENKATSLLNEYMNSGMPAITTQGLGDYSNLLKATSSPEETTNWYNQYRAPVRARAFNEQIAPATKEQFVPGGNLFGTDIAKMMTNKAESWAEQGQQELGNTIQSDKTLNANLLTQLPTMSGLQGEDALNKAKAGFTYGALSRMLNQQELNAEIDNFYKTLPEMSPVLDLAKSLLGMQTIRYDIPSYKQNEGMVGKAGDALGQVNDLFSGGSEMMGNIGSILAMFM